jgi:protein-glutamine gamma-glutamyltransferase
VNLSRRYIVSVFVLMALGILAYSVADDDLTPFLIAAPVLIAGWMVNGGANARPLPRWVVNTALLVATGHMATSWSDSVADTVGVLCRYLVWLQLIKTFEARTPRDQGQVIVLSSMLVVGACLTSVTVDLGIVLALYLPVLLVTAMLFQVWAEHERCVRDARPPRPASADAPVAFADQLRAAVRRFLGPTSLGEAAPAMAPVARSAKRHLRRVAWVGATMIAGVAAVAYIVMPRGLAPEIRGLSAGGSITQTGFRDHVQLGSEGFLSDSRRPVGSVRIESRGEVLRGDRTFHLRGAVLDVYDPTRQTWSRSPGANNAAVRLATAPRHPTPPTSFSGPYFIQDITLFHGGHDSLFSLWFPVRVEFSETKLKEYAWNPYDGEVSIPIGKRGVTYRVISAPATIVTAGPMVSSQGRNAVERRPTNAVELPTPWPPRPERVMEPRPPTPEMLRQGPIRALAEEILRRERITDREAFDFRRRAATAFRHWLSRECLYTRQMVAPLDGQDPIEMFLLDEERGRRGHCEYFASAMAALCLSVDIPARVVTGYLLTEFDTSSDSHIIRESDAHAWAEVEVRTGLWETFDPSPISEPGMIEGDIHPAIAAIRGVTDAIELAWSRVIVGYDRDRQEGTLGAVSSISPLAVVRGVNAWVTQILAPEQEQAAGADENRVVVRFFTHVLLGTTVAVVGVYLLVSRWNAISARWRRRRGALDVAPRFEDDPRAAELAELHAQVVARLARLGVPKPHWAPLGLHAESLPPERASLATPLRTLAALYYECRFAGRPVTREVLARATAIVREFDAAARSARA